MERLKRASCGTLGVVANEDNAYLLASFADDVGDNGRWFLDLLDGWEREGVLERELNLNVVDVRVNFPDGWAEIADVLEPGPRYRLPLAELRAAVASEPPDEQVVARIERDANLLAAHGERNGWFRAHLRLTSTEDGGRRRGIFSGYRSSWHWGEHDSRGLEIHHDAPLVIDGQSHLEPGGDATVRLYPTHPAYWNDVAPGHEMEMREGGRVVGRATVLERLPPNPDQNMPFGRWGRIAAPAEAAGAYILIEVESSEGWKSPPPADAIRIWQRRPGVPDDDDSNWTVWLHRDQLGGWIGDRGYVVDEWLPPGVEPDWR